jgi:hypothetical protein
MVTCSFKRGIASRQAESRKVEGIEPRKRRDGKDDAVLGAEVNTGTAVNGKGVSTSPGSETMACLTWGLHGNPGGPALSPQEGGVCRTTEEGGRQMRCRESDGPVVPSRAGNAAGGKGATHGSAV